MSEDRKPGRVRVLKAGDETPQRRRHDSDPITLDGAGGSASRGAPWLMALLFLFAAIGCGAAAELYLP